MRKVSAVLFAVIIFMSGCSAVSKQPYPVITNISFIAEVEYQNKILEYAVTISKNADYKIEILKDSEPTGFTATFKDENISFSYQGLEYKTALSSLADGLIIDLIYTCFDALPKNTPTNSKDDVFFIKNKTQKYDYTIFFSEAGLPIKMEEKNYSITVIFKSMKIL